MGRKKSRHPYIVYRPIRPSDLGILEQLHSDLFPIRYESEFFYNVVNHRDIVSWGAVDRSRPIAQNDDLVGFVTVKMVLATESEIGDLLRYDPAKSEQTLIYILTLGVVEAYRNFGIASSLIREVTRYARTIATCQAVYLHVISYNIPAIHLYKKMSFDCARRLYGFYLIGGRHYDAYLFVYYVNGGRSPCSPLELVIGVVNYLKSSFKYVAGRIWRYEDRNGWKWISCKENFGMLTTQSKRSLSIDHGTSEFQCELTKQEV